VCHIMPGRKLAAKRLEWNSEENKDVVIVHMYPRHEKCANVSPFGLKLETWLRLHDIKYKPDHDCPSHAETSKSPWISYNGDEVTDSQLIIEFLTEKLGLAKAEAARPEDRVVSRGLRAILEDNLNFCRSSEMFIFGDPEDLAGYLPTFFAMNKAINKFVTKRVVKMIGNQPKAQGIGRLKKDEVMKMVEDDLETVSLALGEKPFVLGNEASEIDAVLFGFLACIMYLGPLNHQIPKILDKFSNLKAHTERMKEKLWPDWDELLETAAKKNEPPAAKATAAPAPDENDKTEDTTDTAAKEEENKEKEQNGEKKEEENKEE